MSILTNAKNKLIESGVKAGLKAAAGIGAGLMAGASIAATRKAIRDRDLRRKQIIYQFEKEIEKKQKAVEERHQQRLKNQLPTGPPLLKR
jgi:hypothetical protein